jgi:hypothetical protein
MCFYSAWMRTPPVSPNGSSHRQGRSWRRRRRAEAVSVARGTRCLTRPSSHLVVFGLKALTAGRWQRTPRLHAPARRFDASPRHRRERRTAAVICFEAGLRPGGNAGRSGASPRRCRPAERPAGQASTRRRFAGPPSCTASSCALRFDASVRTRRAMRKRAAGGNGALPGELEHEQLLAELRSG